MLSGHLTEELYDEKINKIKTTDLSKDMIGYLDNKIGYHRMINKSNDIAVSLHLYSPPKYKMNIYDNGGN